MSAITITSTEQWLALRQQHICGSEIAPMLGESERMTPFELFLLKSGMLEAPDYSDNEYVFWGQCLEPAIARGVELKTGWKVEKANVFYSDLPDCPLGGTPDYFIEDPERGLGVLEIKNVESFMWKRWGNEMPLSFQLQPQIYCGLSGCSWALTAALIGGNRLELVMHEARPRTMEIVRERVSAFWQAIVDNKPPAADYTRDADAIARLHRSVEAGKVIDMSESNRLPELCAEYQRAAAAKGVEDKARKAAQAEILTIIGDAETVICGDLTIKAAEVRGVPDRIISQADVGTIIKGRSGYRGLHVSKRKTKEQVAA
jgi:predicted phage-related endonuclease